MNSVPVKKKNRTRRLNVRATARQERLIRTGAETIGVSVTDFILESACLQAEQTLADKREDLSFLQNNGRHFLRRWRAGNQRT